MSAVEGLKVATASSRHTSYPITAAILTGLFFIQRQRHGESRHAVWADHGTVVCRHRRLGLHQIIQTPAILAAINPSTPTNLHAPRPAPLPHHNGAVILAVTGAEALYADLGHFGKRPDPPGLVSPGLLVGSCFVPRSGSISAQRPPDSRRQRIFSLVPQVPIWQHLPIYAMVILATHRPPQSPARLSSPVPIRWRPRPWPFACRPAQYRTHQPPSITADLDAAINGCVCGVCVGITSGQPNSRRLTAA